MSEFDVPTGHEAMSHVCPFCGFIENTKPKIMYHLFPGTILNNRYTIGVVLGSGGFGIIYKAWDSALGIVVAIKEHYPAALVQRVPGTTNVIAYEGEKKNEYRESLERFLEEAQNTAQFDNPNIVHVDNYFEENNTAYIVMEFLDGISLKDYLKMNGEKLDVKDIDYIFLPIMNALKTIHEKGFIHRDVSPDNIYLCLHGEVKLIDFGAARFSDNDKGLTRSVILKPGYAPPEQYQSKSVQGPWTDLYALSATLYRTITGKDPVESVNRFFEEFVDKNDQLVEPKEYIPDIPDNLNNLIVKGMSIEPALRFRSVEEFEAAYKGKKVITPYEERKKRLIRRAVGITAAALVILLGVFIFFNLYYDRRKGVKLESTRINLFMPYDETKMTYEEANAYAESLISAFNKEYEQITVSYVVIPREAYWNMVEEERKTTGRLPTIFMSDSASDEVLNQTIQLEGTLDYIEFSDLNYMDQFKEELSSGHCIPTGYDLPVVYVKTQTNDVDAKNLKVEKLDDICNAKGFYVDEKNIVITAKTLGVSEEELRNKMTKSDDSLDDFAKGNITYYLSTAENYNRMVEKVGGGRFEVRPYGVNTVYAKQRDCWSISAAADENETLAAEVLIAYMMMDNVQRERMVSGYDYALPFDKTSYDEYLKVYGKLDILREYENIDFGDIR